MEGGALSKWLEISLDLKKAKNDVFKRHGITNAYFKNTLSVNALAEFKSLGGDPVAIKGYKCLLVQEHHHTIPRGIATFVEEKLVLFKQ